MYINFDWNPKVLVFQSEKHKLDLNSKIMPEVWSIQTCKNYLEYLKQND